MIGRPSYLEQLATAVRRSPVTALLGPRQCGKTTLARLFGAGRQAIHFDLESQPDQRRLQNPELILGSCQGLVILDEIQVMPELFDVLRVLVDRPETQARFLILDSASPDIIRNVSETLAGRVELVELAGFDLRETVLRPGSASGSVVASHVHSSLPRMRIAWPGARGLFVPS
jgi:predicted AAA+ superfamily ATPase